MILSQRHDVIAIHLKDRREEELPNVGLLEIEDRETGGVLLVDTSDKKVRQKFQESARVRQENLARMFKMFRIDKIEIGAEGSYVEPLMKFFKLREKRT